MVKLYITKVARYAYCTLNVMSDELAALSPVKRQQQIYAHLNPWITDGSIHAVTMKFFSRAAWAERT